MSKKFKVAIYLLIVFLGFMFNFYYRPIEGNRLVKKDSPTYVNELYYSD